MASSRKSKPNSLDSLEAKVGAALGPLLFPGARLVLGLSGGLDSVVLLEVLRGLAGPLGFQLSCVHVNHHISPNANRWAAFCARLCKRHKIALALHDVDVAPYRAEGLEAAARRARYQVYAGQDDADFIVLAQHLDDQAETLLLQLLRGAGVKGGAAMPLIRAQDRGNKDNGAPAPAILRPMLATIARADRSLRPRQQAQLGRGREQRRHAPRPQFPAAPGVARDRAGFSRLSRDAGARSRTSGGGESDSGSTGPGRCETRGAGKQAGAGGTPAPGQRPGEEPVALAAAATGPGSARDGSSARGAAPVVRGAR